MRSFIRRMVAAYRKPAGSRANRCKLDLDSLEDRTVPAEVNIAFNPTRADFPSPQESDRGWGGGSDAWDILDGREDYPEWYHGLAFTGGRLDYVEPAGPRQATINFGQDQTFHEVILWHHGLNHVPADTNLEYWDGSQWNPIAFTRFVDVSYHSRGAGATPDYYFFGNVTGSKVRYSLDNRLSDYQGDQQIEHGWLYEFEVYSTVDEGASPGPGAGLDDFHAAVSASLAGSDFARFLALGSRASIPEPASSTAPAQRVVIPVQMVPQTEVQAAGYEISTIQGHGGEVIADAPGGDFGILAGIDVGLLS